MKRDKHRRIKANTLSVIRKGSQSVHCGLKVGDEYTNVTLRFDRGNKALICGYPQNWDIHDVQVDLYDSESPTGADMYSCHGDVEGQVYIAPETEVKILRQLKRDIENQFVDIAWIEECPTLTQKLKILNKIERAIQCLT